MQGGYTPVMELAPGAEIDRYVVEELLGRGGMAAVYRVLDRELGATFALKVLDVPSPSVRQRLQQEGQIQATLRHPNVVAVVGIVFPDGVPALVLEYVDGPTLEGLLRVHRPTLAQIDDLADGILRGVRAAHRHGLVHRDLKPANILLQRTDDGFVPRISDFGLAKVLGLDVPGTTHTRTGAVLGTPAYMAPEQFRSAKVDERADVYALGVTLYELCTGERPYDASDLFRLADLVRSGEVPRPRDKVPELPERMEAAILGALRVDPAERWADVDAMRAAWHGRSQLPDDRAPAWDRALLDSMSRSSAGSSASSRPRSERSGRDAPHTWASRDGGSLADGARAARTPTRPPSLARRAAPLVAVMGLSLAVLLGVGVVGGGAALTLVGTRAGAPPPAPPEQGPPPATAVPDAGPPRAEPAPAPSPAPASAAPPRSESARRSANLRAAPLPPGRPASLDDVPAEPEVVAPPPPPERHPGTPAEPTTLGSWSARGDAASVTLTDASGRSWAPGAVPPGPYSLRATFADGRTFVLAVSVRADEPHTIECAAATGSCRVLGR